RLIYSLFKVPVRKRVLNKPSLMNKIISMFLGLVNGYVLGMLFMFIFNPLIGLNYDKPVTKFYIESTNEVLTFSSLNELQNVNIKRFNYYEDILNQLTGRTALNHYNDILAKFNEFESLEDELKDVLLLELSEASKVLIDSSDILNSFYTNSDQIIVNEKTNPTLFRLKEIKSIVENNYVYFVINNSISDYELITIHNYIDSNYDDLVSKITRKIHLDSFN